MSNSNANAAVKGRRRSLFTRRPLSALTQIQGEEQGTDLTSTLKKKRPPSTLNSPSSPLSDVGAVAYATDTLSSPVKASVVTKPTSGRPASIFGSLRSFRPTEEYGEPLTATSSKPPSINWGETGESATRSRNVLHHGEVQTSSSMFRKKREYLVLTDTHLVRLKSHQKATETFSASVCPTMVHKLG